MHCIAMLSFALLASCAWVAESVALGIPDGSTSIRLKTVLQSFVRKHPNYADEQWQAEVIFFLLVRLPERTLVEEEEPVMNVLIQQANKYAHEWDHHMGDEYNGEILVHGEISHLASSKLDLDVENADLDVENAKKADDTDAIALAVIEAKQAKQWVEMTEPERNTLEPRLWKTLTLSAGDMCFQDAWGLTIRELKAQVPGLNPAFVHSDVKKRVEDSRKRLDRYEEQYAALGRDEEVKAKDPKANLEASRVLSAWLACIILVIVFMVSRGI